jgi:hypothetical protein
MKINGFPSPQGWVAFLSTLLLSDIHADISANE